MAAYVGAPKHSDPRYAHAFACKPLTWPLRAQVVYRSKQLLRVSGRVPRSPLSRILSVANSQACSRSPSTNRQGSQKMKRLLESAKLEAVQLPPPERAESNASSLFNYRPPPPLHVAPLQHATKLARGLLSSRSFRFAAQLGHQQMGHADARFESYVSAFADAPTLRRASSCGHLL